MPSARVELTVVPIDKPDEVNLIRGQAHFIKAIEDLYEVVVQSMPGIRFGVAFCESSGPCLVRVEGNDAEMKDLAVKNAREIGAGHSFLIFLRNAYPVNVLGAVKSCAEVCRVICATGNPVQVIVAGTGQGRGILGVIDGDAPQGVEDEAAAETRHDLLRQLGYKR
jgi:adenosine/AMP kinase